MYTLIKYTEIVQKNLLQLVTQTLPDRNGMGPWLIIMYNASFILHGQQELARAQVRLLKKLRMNINVAIKTLKPTLLVWVGLSAALLLLTTVTLSHFFLSWMLSYPPAVEYIKHPSPMVIRSTASCFMSRELNKGDQENGTHCFKRFTIYRLRFVKGLFFYFAILYFSEQRSLFCLHLHVFTGYKLPTRIVLSTF